MLKTKKIIANGKCWLTIAYFLFYLFILYLKEKTIFMKQRMHSSRSAGYLSTTVNNKNGDLKNYSNLKKVYRYLLPFILYPFA